MTRVDQDVVERMAEAMYEEAESTTHGGWHVSWGKARDFVQADYRDMARAALKVLRGDTDA